MSETVEKLGERFDTKLRIFRCLSRGGALRFRHTGEGRGVLEPELTAVYAGRDVNELLEEVLNGLAPEILSRALEKATANLNAARTAVEDEISKVPDLAL